MSKQNYKKKCFYIYSLVEFLIIWHGQEMPVPAYRNQKARFWSQMDLKSGWYKALN